MQVPRWATARSGATTVSRVQGYMKYFYPNPACSLWMNIAVAKVVPPAGLQVNMRGKVDATVRARHAKAPETVQWHSGVLLPKGLSMSNGTWSPRHVWR